MNKFISIIINLKDRLKNRLTNAVYDDFEIDDFDHRPYYELVSEKPESDQN